MNETEKISLNGALVDWADATVHVGVHALHYGSGVLEGIHRYETPQGPAVFRLGDRLRRLHDSARRLSMEIPYAVEELGEATGALVRRNGLASCYIRPIAFYGYGELSVSPAGAARRLGISYHCIRAWLSGRRKNMHEEKAVRVLRSLCELRSDAWAAAEHPVRSP